MDDSKKRSIIIVTGLLLTAGLALGGWKFGRPVYRDWKQTKFLAEARESLAKQEYTNAILCARKVLMMNPRNVGACRVMAGICEAARSREILHWREQIASLEPEVPSNHLALARAALLHGDLARARKAMNQVDEAGRKSPSFHELAAILALSTNQAALSEEHMAEAARLDPENKRVQFSLAVLHLQTEDSKKIEDGGRSLQQLSTNESFRFNALRSLKYAALKTNGLAEAIPFSRELAEDPKSAMADRIQHLNLLTQAKHSEAAAFLDRLRREAASQTQTIVVIADWMRRHGQMNEAIQWLNTLPEEARKSVPAVMAKSDLLLAGKDWEALDQALQEQKWGQHEYARQAMLARVAAERKQQKSREVLWKAAIRESNQQARPLRILLQMATVWEWPEERDQILWLLVERFPTERWVYGQLERNYQQTGNSVGLNKVYTALLDGGMTNLVVRNNFAATCLLLKINLTRAHQVARELYQERPQDPVVTATFAYSQHLQGETEAALETMAKLKDEDIRKEAGVAASYGLMLAAKGDHRRARQYLETAAQGKLLLEEKAMVDAALKALP